MPIEKKEKPGEKSSEQKRRAIRARTKAMQDERIKANIDACIADIKNDRKETTACQDEMEANL
jgi:hypothetical protein